MDNWPKDVRGRLLELPEDDVRSRLKYGWVYDCSFRDSFLDQGTISFIDVARCEFEAKLLDGKWKHFTISYRIGKYDREMDVMIGFSNALEMSVEKGLIQEGNKIFEIIEVKPSVVPEDQKKWLMKNRTINVLEHHEDAEGDAIVRSILEGNTGARSGP